MNGRLAHPRSRAAGLAVVVVTVLALTGLTGCVPTVKAAASSTGTPGGSSVAVHKSAVPAPGGGSIDETVAPSDPGAVTQVHIGEVAALPSKVNISIVSAKTQKVTAKTPGETSGPAVVTKVRITNDTASAIDLGSTVVMLTYSAGTLGQATTASPAEPFTDSVAPGKSLDATYVFNVASSAIDPIQISVSYAGGAPVALFAGGLS